MSRDRADYSFEKDVEVDVDVDLKLDATVDLTVDNETDIDVDVKSDVDLDGNTAEITFDVQAVGDETLVQGELVVLTVDNELSQLTGFFGSYTD